jgi:UDP-glucose 4-epimerase
MKTILITGGNGYIGQYLVEYYNQLGYKVIVTSRHKVENSNYETRIMNMLDENSIINVCSDVDIVIHAATMDERDIKGNEKETYLVNAYGTRLLFLDSVRNNVEKFIYLSTFHVYGKMSGVIDEDTIINPKSDYGLSHYFAERYLQQLSYFNKTCVSVLRLTNGIGVPMGNSNKWYLAVNDFCRMAYYKNEIELKSSGTGLRDFVAINDIVTATDCIINAMDNGLLFEVYNVSEEVSYSIREMAKIVAEIYEHRYKKSIRLKIPTVSENEIINPLYISSQKLRNLGWTTTSTVEMVIQSIFDQLEHC